MDGETALSKPEDRCCDRARCRVMIGLSLVKWILSLGGGRGASSAALPGTDKVGHDRCFEKAT